MSTDRFIFDDTKKEIKICRHNTPTPWMNYLSNGTFHTMISQAAGGVAFYKSPQIWRINRYRFFHLPTDRSGFYTYIKDGDHLFCPTAEPLPEKPDKFEAIHGMGYTEFHAKKQGLSAKVKYFVGPLKNALIWELKLKSGRDRHITIFPYVELGMMEFMRELQWQCYNKHQLQVFNEGDVLIYQYSVELQPKEIETPLVYFCADVPVAAFDCDRDEFIGAYRSEENPQRVMNGKCSNSTLMGGDPCFALQLEVDLKADSEKTIHVYLGCAPDKSSLLQAVSHCREKDFCEKSFSALSLHWNEFFSHFHCKLPDKDAQRMINIWNPYQAERNFQFSRNISYYATGTFRGVGYRDTAQDILAMIPFDTARAAEKLALLLGQQYQDGHVNHYFFPIEGWEPVTTIHSDDHLWTILTAHALCIEEGKLDFLQKEIPYYDGGCGTVWEHLNKAIDFTMANLGEHGFPLMLRSDWNDMLYKVCREGKGESIWTAMQFGTALKKMAELAQLLGKSRDKYDAEYDKQKKLINTIGWDGKWFRRAIMDDGRFLGSSSEPQAQIWLNTQTWSVISGMADPEKALMAMDSVYERLNTPLGIKKIDPAMTDYPSKSNRLTNYNKGTGENGSVFCHANTWAIIAECLLGRGDRAYEYYHQLIPAVAQKRAGEWRYKAEPYVYSSNIFGPESDKFGLANVSWLTGTAAWMYIAATQYILGIRPTWNGIEVKPCLPSGWSNIKVQRKFRGKSYHFTLLPE